MTREMGTQLQWSSIDLWCLSVRQSLRCSSVWQFLMSGGNPRKSSVTEIFLILVRTKLPSVVRVIGIGSDPQWNVRKTSSELKK